MHSLTLGSLLLYFRTISICVDPSLPLSEDSKRAWCLVLGHWVVEYWTFIYFLNVVTPYKPFHLLNISWKISFVTSLQAAARKLSSLVHFFYSNFALSLIICLFCNLILGVILRCLWLVNSQIGEDEFSRLTSETQKHCSAIALWTQVFSHPRHVYLYTVRLQYYYCM